MTKTIFAAALGALALAPTSAFAQATPAPVVIVVDIDRVANTCNACKTAIAALSAQQKGLTDFVAAQDASYGKERDAIQAEYAALAGKEPGAALVAKADAWAKRRDAAQQQVTARELSVNRNREYVNFQIRQKMDPAVNAVMAKRGANVALDASQVVRVGPTLDATADLLAQVNATLTTISTTAPAQSAAPAASRPATATSATQPKTTPKKK